MPRGRKEQEEDADKSIALSRYNLDEYRRMLTMLDHQQHQKLTAHLYSAFLISMKPLPPTPSGAASKKRVPPVHWTAWPIPNAPPLPDLDSTVAQGSPRPITLNQLRNSGIQQSESYPSFFPGSERKAMLKSCESFLKQTVYDRIHNDKRSAVKLEPVLDPEPRIAPQWESEIFKLLDKYVDVPGERPIKSPDGGLAYYNLSFPPAAQKRIQALFKGQHPELVRAGIKKAKKAARQKKPKVVEIPDVEMDDPEVEIQDVDRVNVVEEVVILPEEVQAGDQEEDQEEYLEEDQEEAQEEDQEEAPIEERDQEEDQEEPEGQEDKEDQEESEGQDEPEDQKESEGHEDLEDQEESNHEDLEDQEESSQEEPEVRKESESREESPIVPIDEDESNNEDVPDQEEDPSSEEIDQRSETDETE